ncbi:MAG: hypothetical protein GQE15_42265 [Archangiaceae bacterium]|nr:hypothetical protein [Archangiaceae bacterium]
MSWTRDISVKFESTSRQSAEVTAALTAFKTPAAVEMYARIQAAESEAVRAATSKQSAARIAAEATRAYETLRKNVRLLNVACVNVCEIRGIVSGEYFTVVDRGDEAGLARRLEPEMRRVPGYGPPLADGLAHMLRDLTTAETVSAEAKARLTSSQRDLDAAVLSLQSAVAQGRAVLATLGVKLTLRIKKKAELTKSPASIVPQAA